MFFALRTDRGNLDQAIADNLLKDLHLTTNGESLTIFQTTQLTRPEYNIGNTIFLVSFLLAEVPSPLVS